MCLWPTEEDEGIRTCGIRLVWLQLDWDNILARDFSLWEFGRVLIIIVQSLICCRVAVINEWLKWGFPCYNFSLSFSLSLDVSQEHILFFHLTSELLMEVLCLSNKFEGHVYPRRVWGDAALGIQKTVTSLWRKRGAFLCGTLTLLLGCSSAFLRRRWRRPS